MQSLTTEQLHPSARFVDSGGVAEEKQREASNAAQDEHHGHQNEEGGCLESARRDGTEIAEGPLTCELPVGVPGAHTVVKQAEVTGVWGVNTVPDPVRLNEHHYIDNGQAYGKYGPEDANGT